MFWDVTFVIVAFISGAIQTWLGFDVSTSFKALTARHKRTYRMLFLVCTLVNFSMVITLAYRATRQRAHLALAVQPAHKPPDTYTSLDWWSVAYAFIPVDWPLEFNVYYKNVGDGPAFNVYRSGRVYIEPDISLNSSRDAVERFESWRKTEANQRSGWTIERGESGFVSFKGDIVSPEDYQNLVNGRRIAYIVGLFSWDDDSGAHSHELCKRLQPPFKAGTSFFRTARSTQRKSNLTTMQRGRRVTQTAPEARLLLSVSPCLCGQSEFLPRLPARAEHKIHLGRLCSTPRIPLDF